MRQGSPDLHLELGLESVKSVIPKRHSPKLESRVKVKQNAPRSAVGRVFQQSGMAR